MKTEVSEVIILFYLDEVMAEDYSRFSIPYSITLWITYSRIKNI